jgi:NAD(P)-dependent dehydrogenase (short-subunit alcohol dehydrogenase family)
MKIKNANCLVTGSSSGIGRAISLALAAAGAKVWATARRMEAINDLQSQGISVLELDVHDDGAARRAVEHAGVVDILVNSAGYGLYGSVEEVSDAELLEQFDTNFFGPWRLCRAVLPGMRSARSGIIVNISSFAGLIPFPNGGPYRASKYALEALSGTLHFEVTHFGIRVINAQVGRVATRFGDSMKTAAAGRGDSPYSPMRDSVKRAFPNMCPSTMSPALVADEIVKEIGKDKGPYRITIGEDAKRLIAMGAAGDVAYERFVVEQLGLDWHPLDQG